MSFFIPFAFAQQEAANVSSSAMPQIVMLLGFFAVFYLLLWRPQAKRAKEQRQLLSSLKKGDEITTIGGIVGKITQVNDTMLQVALSKEIKIQLQKSAVASILPNGTLKLDD